MAYVVQDAPDGWAVDTSFPVSPALAKLLAQASLPGGPVLGVCQYVGLQQNSASDISADRLQGILDAGLGCWLVQHVRMPGWVASGDLGKQLGAAAKRNAVVAGYAEGAHLALDLEGCASVGDVVVDFVNEWCGQVEDTFNPLLYVGYACGLTPDQLYHSLPSVRAYWSDYGPRSVAVRGFCVKQHAQTRLCGVDVDPDELRADALGGRLRWMVADGTQAAA